MRTELLPPVEAVDGLTADQLPAFVIQLTALAARAAVRIRLERTPSDADDRLLTIEQAAERLATTEDWLRRQRHLPFRVELSPGQVRYSAHGLTRWLTTRIGRPE